MFGHHNGFRFSSMLIQPLLTNKHNIYDMSFLFCFVLFCNLPCDGMVLYITLLVIPGGHVSQLGNLLSNPRGAYFRYIIRRCAYHSLSPISAQYPLWRPNISSQIKKQGEGSHWMDHYIYNDCGGRGEGSSSGGLNLFQGV